MKKESIIPLKEKLISFETAVLAKEKGFRNACDWSVNKDNEYIFMPDLLYPNNSEFTYNPEEDPEVIEWEDMMKTLVLAPTQSLLQKWLRKIYSIHITITSISQESWQYHIQKPKDKLGDNYNEDFEDYEEALEDGLLAALKLIKP